MTWLVVLVAAVAALLAFANGANDNSKGVASLIGSGTLSLKAAIWFAAATTLAGSLAAIWLATNLAARFGGKGIVDPQIVAQVAFPISVGLAAAATVLLATRIGIPISTTHALVGAIVGVGFWSGALHWQAVLDVFLVPLMVSPLLAILLAAGVYVVFRWARQRLGVTHQDCVCIEKRYYRVTVQADGSMAFAATGLAVSSHVIATCRQRYDGRVTGIDAQTALNWSHLTTAGAVSFARGLNDAPKIAGLLIAVTAVTGSAVVMDWTALTLVAVAMAAGGLLAVRRVAQTMSFRITGMNDGQAFTANLVTASLVIGASLMGSPVSTTHVSCGSLFGIGSINRQAHWGMIGRIMLAWVTTLPIAAALSGIIWYVIA